MPSPPELDDGIMHYIYSPCEATLYGYDGQPYRFLRVMPNGIDNFVSMITRKVPVGGGQYDEARFSIESVTLSTFLSYIAFGYTPYIEVLFSVGKCGLQDYQDIKPYLLTHALCRSYETRVKALLDVGERKASSIVTRNGGAASELVAELRCCLALWQEVLDAGQIMPRNALSAPMKVEDSSLDNGTIKRCREWMLELQARMLSGNYVNLPYKTDDDMQTAIMGMWNG